MSGEHRRKKILRIKYPPKETNHKTSKLKREGEDLKLQSLLLKRLKKTVRKGQNKSIKSYQLLLRVHRICG